MAFFFLFCFPLIFQLPQAQKVNSFPSHHRPPQNSRAVHVFMVLRMTSEMVFLLQPQKPAVGQDSNRAERPPEAAVHCLPATLVPPKNPIVARGQIYAQPLC